MSGLIVFAVIVLMFVVVLMIGHASDLARDLRGEWEDSSKNSRLNGMLLIGFLVVFFVGIAYSAKMLVPLMIPKSASLHGVETDNLFYITLIIISVVFVITQVGLFYFGYRYNESRSKEPLFYPHNNKLEVVWTAIPAFVMAILVIFGLKVWLHIFNVEARDTQKMMVIEATAKQFNWIIRYPGADGKLGDRVFDKEHISPTNELGIDWKDATSHDDFFPDKIYLVKDRPVLFQLGALDVLHSFYLPHFRVKMDCVPGVPTEFYFTPTITTAEMQQYLSTLPWWQQVNPATGEARWKTFKYELACAELCGKSHYGMQREVVVVTQEEYDAWMKSQKAAYAPPAPAEAAPVGEATQPEGKTETINKPQAMLSK